MPLSSEQVAAFHRDGFLALERLVGDDTVEELRAAYDALLEREVEAPGDRMLGGVTRQIVFPSLAHPGFAANAALDAAARIVAQLYPAPCQARVHDMLIAKPPGHARETPWHQDAGYYAMPVAAAGSAIPLGPVQVWLALDDVDEDGGCMQFLPGQHTRPLLEHVVVSGAPDDEGRLIAIRDLDALELGAAVACPLRAGGCTMHTPGTPHYTGPNKSARPRRAYIFNLLSGGPGVRGVEASIRRGAVEAGVLPRRVLEDVE